ncbi:MAG TPA: HD-GYP domain-containing protein [Actinomycetota bacterium]|nr:HD-GYP domain-containing protein [Actinomycetota bacterium]
MVRSLGRRGWALLGALLVAPTAVTLALRAVPALDVAHESPLFHLVVVSGITGLAFFIAVVTTVAAARDRRPAPVLLAVACVSVGALMLGHGLTTPGIGDRPMNMWVARLPVLAITGFAVALLAATGAEKGYVKRFVGRHPRATLLASASVLTAFAAFVSLDPTRLAGTAPFPGEDEVGTALALASGAALLLLGTRHWIRWRLGRDRVELSLVLASWLAADAVVSLKLGELWRLSWWDYHAYLLAGFGAASWAVLVGLRTSRSARQAVASISVADALEHIDRGSPEALHALTAAVEAKDPYTHGHSARVARLAVGIGERLGLEADALRRLAQGARLHDIGKIGVPDAVLNKPEGLSQEEWEWIKAHPVVGWEIASRAPSLRSALEAIRYHHERWDGSGYPDGRTGEETPLPARIAAVADMWDALTSDRAYRPAWPVEQALAHLVAGSGRLFDPACVEAFVELMSKGVGVERVDLDRAVLAAAAEACHRLANGSRLRVRHAG